MKIKNKIIISVFLLLVLGAFSLFATSPESYLQRQMVIMNDLYSRLVTSNYSDNTVKQRLLKNLPDLIAKLKSYPSAAFSNKAAHFESMLKNIRNPGRPAGSGVTGTGSNQNIPAGQTNTQAGGTVPQTPGLQPAPMLTVKVMDASGQELQGASNVIKLYKNGSLWKQARGSSYTFPDLTAGTYRAEASATGFPVCKSTSITYSGSPPNWRRVLTIQLPMRIKVFIREAGKRDLIPGAYASMNNGPVQFCPTGTVYFPVTNPGVWEIRAKAIAHAEFIKRIEVPRLTSYQEVFIDLFPAPTLLVEVRGASGQLFTGANVTISLFKNGQLLKAVKGAYYLFTELDAGAAYHALANAVGLPPKSSKTTRWPGSPFRWTDTLVIRY
jgi:hypothetical protein